MQLLWNSLNPLSQTQRPLDSEEFAEQVRQKRSMVQFKHSLGHCRQFLVWNFEQRTSHWLWEFSSAYGDLHVVQVLDELQVEQELMHWVQELGFSSEEVLK